MNQSKGFQMTHTTILTRLEMESMGPPAPEEVADTDVSEGFLSDLALKHVAQSPTRCVCRALSSRGFCTASRARS